MTTRQTPDAVRDVAAVIQADRDAAFSYWCYTRSIPTDNNRAVEWRCKLNHGDFDGREIVQAFARHRDAALDSRAGDAGEGLAANSMNLVEGTCTPIKALQPSYDPLNGYVIDNLPRWILDGWTSGNETYEGASEQMQEWANDAARAVVSGIRQDMESLEPATPAPPVNAPSKCPECGDTSPLEECATCGAYPTRKDATPAPAVDAPEQFAENAKTAGDAVPAGEVVEQADAAVRNGDYRMGYLRMCEAYGKLAALSHGEGL